MQARNQETKNLPRPRSWVSLSTRPVCMHMCVRRHAHMHRCDLTGNKAAWTSAHLWVDTQV